MSADGFLEGAIFYVLYQNSSRTSGLCTCTVSCVVTYLIVYAIKLMIHIQLLHTVALSNILCINFLCLVGESAVVHISASRRMNIYFLEIENSTAKNTQPWGEGGGGHGGTTAREHETSCVIGVGTWKGKRREGSASSSNFPHPPTTKVFKLAVIPPPPPPPPKEGGYGNSAKQTMWGTGK